jgi:hypothetical protein
LIPRPSNAVPCCPSGDGISVPEHPEVQNRDQQTWFWIEDEGWPKGRTATSCFNAPTIALMVGMPTFLRFQIEPFDRYLLAEYGPSTASR